MPIELYYDFICLLFGFYILLLWVFDCVVVGLGSFILLLLRLLSFGFGWNLTFSCMVVMCFVVTLGCF